MVHKEIQLTAKWSLLMVVCLILMLDFCEEINGRPMVRYNFIRLIKII